MKSQRAIIEDRCASCAKAYQIVRDSSGADSLQAQLLAIQEGILARELGRTGEAYDAASRFSSLFTSGIPDIFSRFRMYTLSQYYSILLESGKTEEVRTLVENWYDFLRSYNQESPSQTSNLLLLNFTLFLVSQGEGDVPANKVLEEVKERLKEPEITAVFLQDAQPCHSAWNHLYEFLKIHGKKAERLKVVKKLCLYDLEDLGVDIVSDMLSLLMDDRKLGEKERGECESLLSAIRKGDDESYEGIELFIRRYLVKRRSSPLSGFVNLSQMNQDVSDNITNFFSPEERKAITDTVDVLEKKKEEVSITYASYCSFAGFTLALRDEEAALSYFDRAYHFFVREYGNDINDILVLDYLIAYSTLLPLQGGERLEEMRERYLPVLKEKISMARNNPSDQFSPSPELSSGEYGKCVLLFATTLLVPCFDPTLGSCTGNHVPEALYLVSIIPLLDREGILQDNLISVLSAIEFLCDTGHFKEASKALVQCFTCGSFDGNPRLLEKALSILFKITSDYDSFKDQFIQIGKEEDMEKKGLMLHHLEYEMFGTRDDGDFFR